jgi:hypothetical protein
VVGKTGSAISLLFKPSYIHILFFSISHNYIISLIETLREKFSKRCPDSALSGIRKRNYPFFIRNNIFFIYHWNNFLVLMLMIFQQVK